MEYENLYIKYDNNKSVCINSEYKSIIPIDLKYNTNIMYYYNIDYFGFYKYVKFSIDFHKFDNYIRILIKHFINDLHLF